MLVANVGSTYVEVIKMGNSCDVSLFTSPEPINIHEINELTLMGKRESRTIRYPRTDERSKLFDKYANFNWPLNHYWGLRTRILGMKDITTVRHLLTDTVEWILNSWKIDEVIFNPMTWNKFIGTKYLLRKFYKSDAFVVTEEAKSYITNVNWHYATDFDGEIVIRKA